MPDLSVDLDGLSAFAGRLDRIGRALDGAEQVLRGADDDLGDGRVVEALHRFEDRWRDGRQKVQENAETLSTMVTESVAAYRGVDRDLAGQLQVSQQ